MNNLKLHSKEETRIDRIEIGSSTFGTVELTQDDLQKMNDALKETYNEVRSGKQFTVSEELERLAKKIMDDKKLDFGPAEISYLLVYPNISTKRPAKVKKATPELTFFAGMDYLVEISGDLWDMLDNETRYNMMWNQLLHLNPTFTKTGWNFKLRKPDYSDYYDLLEDVGSDWHKTVQEVSSSLYDLSPSDTNQVSLF